MGVSRTRFFYDEEDYKNTKTDSNDRIVIYNKTQKKRKIEYSSLKNTNFSDLEKIDMAIGIMELLDEKEKLTRELTEAYIREKFLLKKLLEAGVSSAFSPEELKEFKVTIDVVLREKIDKVLEGDLLEIKKDIALRVQAKIAEAYDEYASNLEYELIRINQILNLNDLEIVDIRKSNIAKDKKSKSLKDLEDMTLKFINKKEELTKSFSKNQSQDNNRSGDSQKSNGFSLGSLGDD